jgi:hypothetical protein
MGNRNPYKIVLRKPDGKRLFGKTMQEDKLKQIFKKQEEDILWAIEKINL